tara:strand:+ start:552 stop:884 length:333 start_codon:yes stop_codon:yes gene_type:complete
VPHELNVRLLTHADNRFAVHSSKAVGEPPFFMGCSVFFAIKDALAAARAQHGLPGHFPLASPATSERIRMAAADTFAAAAIRSVAGADAEAEGDDEARERLASFQPKGSW